MPSALKKRAPTQSKTHTQKNKKDVKKVTITEPPKKRPNGKKHKEPEVDEGESDEGDKEEEEDADDSGSEVEDDEGIDEEGLERLTNALGEEGLDDFDRAQLVALRGVSSDEEEEGHEADSHSEEEEAVEVESGDESADEHEEAGEEEEQEQNAEESNGEDEGEDEDDEGIALDDVESIDEDAVPRQKIEINNTV